MISERIVPGTRLVIQNKDFPADLIVLGIHDFDIVLGMDWLSKHRATLDCYKKEKKIGPSRGTRCDISGNQKRDRP